jgi:hypothetical protein
MQITTRDARRTCRQALVDRAELCAVVAAAARDEGGGGGRTRARQTQRRGVALIHKPVFEFFVVQQRLKKTHEHIVVVKERTTAGVSRAFLTINSRHQALKRRSRGGRSATSRGTSRTRTRR